MIVTVRSKAVRLWGGEANDEGDYEDDGVVDGSDHSDDRYFLEDGDVFLEDEDEHQPNSSQIDDDAD